MMQWSMSNGMDHAKGGIQQLHCPDRKKNPNEKVKITLKEWASTTTNEDRTLWRQDKGGIFTIKATYHNFIDGEIIHPILSGYGKKIVLMTSL